MADNKFERDGIILLNKEKGMTSFAAVNKLKKIIKAGKAGHAGTLDPMAEGLLIVMINNVTKFSDDFMKKDKEYYVEFELGYETDTYDLEGEVTRRYEGEIDIPEGRIIEAINSFKGKIEQVPPMYSAIKVKGEKLYNLARKGIEIERKPRKVKIYSVREIKVEKDVFWKVSFYEYFIETPTRYLFTAQTLALLSTVIIYVIYLQCPDVIKATAFAFFTIVVEN